MKRLTLSILAAVLCAGAAVADTQTSSSTTTGSDGLTYTYTMLYDTTSGSSIEKLVSTLADGATHLVASLYTDPNGNWTGQIEGVNYQDQYSDLAGDYVVIVGADTWPTWSAFSDALYALPGWGSASVDGGIFLGGFVIMSATTSSGSGSTTTTKSYGVMNAWGRSGGHRSPRGNNALVQNILKGIGDPNPTTGGKSGK